MEIEYEAWAAEYVPRKNRVTKGRPYDGCMFETFGDDIDFLVNRSKIKAEYIWTLIDCENENQYILPGYHIVDRVGYFITKKPWKSEFNIEVNVNEKITVGDAKYACIEFLTDVLGLPDERFEDQIHDYFSQKF
jgi:hypothetical protein